MIVRRPLLTTIAALGGVITLAGTTGVFAVFTDRATTGQNSFATKDNLGTGLITMTDASPTDDFSTDFVCVKNAVPTT